MTAATAALSIMYGCVRYLNEQLRLRPIAAIIAGFAGVLIVLRPGSDSFNVSALMVLGSTMFRGVNVVLVKILSATDRTASIVAWNAIMLTLLALPLAYSLGTRTPFKRYCC